MRPLLLASLLALAPAGASAQDVAAPPPAAAPQADEVAPPPETAPVPDTASMEAPSPREEVIAPPTPAPEVVPPVMIAVLSTGRVPPEVAAAASAALVEQVRPMAGGRPVLDLALEDMRARLTACADAPCQGAILGEAGAIGAIIARLSRRTARGPVAITLEMIDPMSGAPRVTPLTGELVDAATTAATLAPLVEQLRASMFSPPPPPPTLLVTVNVDGATVMIDGVSVGESPIASQRLTRGQHVVMVTRAGYSGVRREIDLEPGDQERLDLTLAPSLTVTQEIAEDGTVRPRAAEPEWYEQWYVWVGVGAGVLVVDAVIIGVVIATQPPPITPDPMGVQLPSLHF